MHDPRSGPVGMSGCWPFPFWSSGRSFATGFTGAIRSDCGSDRSKSAVALNPVSLRPPEPDAPAQQSTFPPHQSAPFPAKATSNKAWWHRRHATIYR